MEFLVAYWQNTTVMLLSTRVRDWAYNYLLGPALAGRQTGNGESSTPGRAVSVISHEVSGARGRQ